MQRFIRETDNKHAVWTQIGRWHGHRICYVNMLHFSNSCYVFPGSHTLGVSHCRNFQNRLWPIKDDTLSPAFSGMLEMICSNPTLSDISFAQNDATTLYFDNQYFIDIQSGRGLLKIDSEIATDPRTQPYVTAFGQNTQHFFDRFSSGFLKLSNYKVLVGGKGEIRRDCRFINS